MSEVCRDIEVCTLYYSLSCDSLSVNSRWSGTLGWKLQVLSRHLAAVFVCHCSQDTPTHSASVYNEVLSRVYHLIIVEPLNCLI